MPKGESSSVRKATSIFRGKKKERSQPSKRAKLGLLEKHKDYVERARNFHAKEKRIAALQAHFGLNASSLLAPWRCELVAARTATTTSRNVFGARRGGVRVPAPVLARELGAALPWLVQVGVDELPLLDRREQQPEVYL
eukprot:COSAG06_NODE_19466_length_843_cov_0.902439_1_plen_138_part_01